MIDTPACRLLPGLKELTLVESLTRLWDKPSRSPPCCNCGCALKSPYGARNPTDDLPAEEDSASEATGSAERSPRLALPVPVGMVETQADEVDEATEDEAMIAEPSCVFAKGYGRFGIGHTGPATALGNFEQGDIEAESAVVAQWLTSRLRISMSCTGWNLLSTRFSLTKVPGSVLSDYCRKGYPFTPKMADRPYNQYGTIHHSEEKWDQLCEWLTGNPTFSEP